MELPAKQHCRLGQFEVNGLDWQRCLAGSSETAPRIFIFSIFLGAECLPYVKSVATFALTIFGYIISVLASVLCHWQQKNSITIFPHIVSSFEYFTSGKN